MVQAGSCRHCGSHLSVESLIAPEQWCVFWTPLTSSTHHLYVPPFRLSTVGRRSFPVAAATLWNTLPMDVQSSPSLPIFRQRLKTFLFHKSFPDVVWQADYAFVDSVIAYCYFSHVKNFLIDWLIFPHSVINWIQIWRTWNPELRWDRLWSYFLQLSTCAMIISSLTTQCRDIIQVRWKAFSWFCSKFSRKTIHQILSEWPQFIEGIPVYMYIKLLSTFLPCVWNSVFRRRVWIKPYWLLSLGASTICSVGDATELQYVDSSHIMQSSHGQ